jgi:serralysin
LASAQASNGLVASNSLISIIQTGGTSSDTYGYSLDGTGAAAFSLSSSSGTATLAAGSTGVAGGANGQLYSLAVVAKDLNAGTSSPASALNVVVGSSGNDNVSLATLVGGLGTASPAFIYGLGGADKINGAGMTGSLWITGGAGADTMSGGSGANHYLYGAASDSTNTSTDVITNFKPSMDVIDLTGLGSSFKCVGELNPKGKLNAHSVGWETSGGNTFIYANTSSSNGTAGSTDMKIELLGKITLSAGNILHL